MAYSKWFLHGGYTNHLRYLGAHPPSKSFLNSDSLWPGLRMRSLPFILDLDESNVRKVYVAVCRSG